MIPSRAEISAARTRIAPHIRLTPVLTLEAGALGLPFALDFKLEHTQLTGSFKVRGAFNTLLGARVPEAGVVAISGGNHGAAVAHAATTLGHKSTIFVPATIAQEVKLARMRAFGAEVIVAEGTVAEVIARYEAHAAETGAVPVHPYDTPPTVIGQGTVAAEIEAQLPHLDTLMVAVGGGGLIGGVASWFGDHVRIVSVETEGTNTLARSLAEGPEIDVRATGVAAGSLGGPALGRLPWEVVRSRVATALVLSDATVFEAGHRLWEAARLSVEPGAAVALAALTSGAYVPQRDERVGVLLCGGNAEPGWWAGK